MAQRTNTTVRDHRDQFDASEDPLTTGDPRDDVEWAFAVFTRRIEQAARRSDLHGEMDRAGYLLARTLDRQGPASVNDLADQLGLDASTVTRQLSALEKRGFVERAVDPDDRRARILQLTTAGRRTMRSVRAARRHRIDALMADWPADDVETLGRLMTKINDALSS